VQFEQPDEVACQEFQLVVRGFLDPVSQHSDDLLAAGGDEVGEVVDAAGEGVLAALDSGRGVEGGDLVDLGGYVLQQAEDLTRGRSHERVEGIVGGLELVGGECLEQGFAFLVQQPFVGEADHGGADQGAAELLEQYVECRVSCDAQRGGQQHGGARRQQDR
jgi:hypothetical protein